MRLVKLGCCVVATGVLACAQQAAEKIEFFERRIRPVLTNNCYACHTDQKLGGLQVNSRVALLSGGNSGPAINVGNPEDSLLIRAVMHVDPNLQMPLGGPKLKDSEIADLKYWIQTGAVWPDGDAKPAVAPVASLKFTIKPEQRKFWSFQPIQKPAIPTVKDAAWAKTPIDRFILAKLEENNLKPVKQADKRSLIRRAYYDLIGLPPTPEQVDGFLSDNSPEAFAKIVDRLLATPQYGERWARHWLDVAHYADGSERPDRRPVFLGYGTARDGYADTWRYRDWVAQAFNRDMPYDQFVKAQLAADLMPEKDRAKLLPALGFLGIGPWFTGDDVVFVEARANERDDKIDVVSKGFLGLTVTCARCHNHKYDPISQKDYTAMGGIFASSGYWEYNLASEKEVQAYQDQQKKVKAAESALEEYADQCALRVADTLTSEIPHYMMTVRKVALVNPKAQKADLDKAAGTEKLDPVTFDRWFKYLTATEKLHPYLKSWDAMMAKGGGTDAEAQKLAEDFRDMVAKVIPERKAVIASNVEMTRDYKPDANEARVQLPGDLMQFELFQYKQQLVQKVMDTNHYYVWLDVVRGENDQSFAKKDGIFQYKGKDLLRFLTAEEKSKLDAMQAGITALKKAMPPEYPYLMGLKDEPKPVNLKLNIRGNPHALGEEVHRGFPAILGKTDGDPLPFDQGSGRMELADAIVQSPLAARVMVNRIWQHHFGRGIVNTPSDFGMMGDRPSHPELLDYLANRFIESGWSMKAIHREIMLSAAYQEAYEPSEANSAVDPENRLVWRANFRRLEIEAIRDSMLYVTGNLDERVGGPPQSLRNPNFKKRTFYARASRTPDGLLTLFDYPDPNITSEQRSVTNVPLQGLFFMNSELVNAEANALAARLMQEGSSDEDRIQRAYRTVFERPATEAEVQRGLQFLSNADVLFKRAQAEPEAIPRQATPPARVRPADDDDDAPPPPAPAAATKITPWQQYAQALLGSGEFYYIN
jgi:mono/diheme cytochrome c family protein